MATPELEGIHPLSPLQQGMLFHSLLEEETRPYLNQLVGTLEGADPAALRAAWERVVAGHAVLRSAFVYRRREEPLQAVHRRVALPWEERDLRHLSPEAQRDAVARFLREDRARGLELSRAPLMRFTLFRTSEDRWEYVWTHHHLLLDGWSVALVLADLAAAYRALRRGEEPRLPPRRPYADFIAWLGRQEAGAAQAYWRQALRGVDGPTRLGAAAAAPGLAPAAEPEERELSLDAERTRALLGACQRQQVTANTLLQGAWALLLARYAETDDVVFGATTAGRPPELEGVEGMIGLFINTLPVRVRIPGQQPAGAWLRALQAEQARARQHEHVSLGQIQQWTGIPAGTPLFESLLVFENVPGAPPQGGDADPDALRMRGTRGVERTGYPLTLLAAVAGGRLHVSARFEPHLLDGGAVERMLEQLRSLLEAFAADPERPAGQLPLIAAAERARVVAEWNDSGPAADGGTLHGLFARQAARTPDAPALLCGAESLTYAELDARAGRLAGFLRALGVGAESRVGVCLERGTDLIVSLLGVLKAGGAYVPLDPAYPAERVAFMLEDSGAAVVLTRESLLPALPPTAARVVCVDRDAAEIGAAPEAPPVESAPESLAYLIYTSGSTGRPKGVMIQHGSAAALSSWAAGAFDAEERARMIASTSVCFDLSVFEIFFPLACGAAVVLVEDALGVPALGPGAAPTMLNTVPSAAAELVRLGAIPPTLRSVSLAGEPLPGSLAEALYDAGVQNVYNIYAPSETTTYSTGARIPRGLARPPHIGVPLEGERAYVLDVFGQPLPPGLVGELFLGGGGVARGYLGRPSLTAEKFVPDPFSARPGARLYRTGDRARWTAEGVLEFLGRSDHQVKIRGFRIEPGEVEAALRRHPDVREAVVMARDDAAGGRRLVGYVVPDGRPLEGEALKEFLAARLPRHLVPGVFVVLAALPLTPNGKIDRKALPEPEARGGGGFAAPATPVEEILCGVWSEVLGVPEVGIHDDFFALGGHSLVVTRVLARLRAALGVELPVRALFDAPTVARLARRVEEARARADGAEPLPPLVPRAPGVEAPLSFAQERLWYLDQLEPGSAAYTVPAALRLRGPLDADALDRALRALVARHESLRTVVAEADGRPVQRVLPAEGWRVQRADLAAAPDPEAALAARAREDAARPFGLARGPLFRAALLRLGKDDHALLLAMHHVVTDGWSLGVLFRELGALYAAFARGEPDPLPPLPLQYADFALWQRGRAGEARIERELDYWRRGLAGAPELLELPYDRPRPPVPSRRGGVERVEVAPELAERLRALARREGCSLFMVLLAAWQTLLSRWSGQEDVVVGTSIAGRTRQEVEGMIGMFFNALPLRTDLAGEPTFRALLRRVRETTLGAYEHQEVPFDRLVAEAQPVRSAGHAPLFQVLLELHNAPGGGIAFPGVEVSPVASGTPAAKLDLALIFTDSAAALAGELHYAAELWDAETIRRLRAQLGVLLEAAVADPDRPVTRLAILPPEERRRVVEEWNDTARPLPPACIHQLFEEQAARTPDAVAVEFGAETLTYAELDARANRLAQHLRRRGVGPEVRVAFCLERAPELVAVLLGILKAGGAYVPLDPTHPAERLRYMLEDSGASLLLTQARLIDRLPRGAAEILDVAACEAAAEAESAESPAPLAGPDGLAYVYYTSGSTGRPKGVAMHHLGVVNYIRWGREAYGADRGLGAPVFSSMAVDLTLTNFLPLFAGTRVVLIPEGPGVEALARDLRRRPGYALVKITPTHLALLNHELAPEEAAASTRTLVIGADNLLAEPTLPWQDGAPNVVLLNEYGPTETVVGCAIYALAAGDHREGPIPIGRAIDNITLYVLDPRGEPAPIGVPGELFIGGVGVARGYLGLPARTAEKFVPDPFAGRPGARMYRSGDRARWLPRGEMEFLGRMDFQVKIRGYRIEIGEVEAILAAHPGVREVLVMAREDRPGDTRLVAYVAPQGDPPTAAELRAALRERLPEYMVPSAFVMLDALPVAASGKVDRRALPAPDASEPHSAAGYEPPADEVEAGLVEVWEEEIGVRPIGVADAFFDIGGNSLLAVRLMRRVRDRFGCDVPLSALVVGGTVRDLAAAVRGRLGARPAAGADPLVPLQPDGARPPLFCVHPAGGNVHCYLNLARHLDPDQPVYGLQDPLAPSGRVSDAPLEEMAALYVRAVRAARPHGPYHLLGWSFGGVVAFEMARQLAAAGQEVGLLGLLDAARPGFWPLERDDDTDARVLAAIVREMGEARGRPAALSADELRGVPGEERDRRVVRCLAAAGLVPEGTDPGVVPALLRQWWARLDTQRGYRAGRYPGRITLFLSTSGDPEFERDFPEVAALRAADPALGWGPLAEGGVQVRPVAGTHATLASEPHVHLLAGAVAGALAAAGGAPAGSAPAREEPAPREEGALLAEST